MLLPRPIKKMLAVFRGSVSPVMIFISITLGFWFGLIPDFAGIHVAVLVRLANIDSMAPDTKVIEQRAVLIGEFLIA